MTPTPKLRFVERIQKYDSEKQNFGKHERILQQWWAVERNGQVTPDGEWRDVPLESESIDAARGGKG